MAREAAPFKGLEDVETMVLFGASRTRPLPGIPIMDTTGATIRL